MQSLVPGATNNMLGRPYLELRIGSTDICMMWIMGTNRKLWAYISPEKDHNGTKDMAISVLEFIKKLQEVQKRL